MRAACQSERGAENVEQREDAAVFVTADFAIRARGLIAVSSFSE
jgi:hypothetical protein